MVSTTQFLLDSLNTVMKLNEYHLQQEQFHQSETRQYITAIFSTIINAVAIVASVYMAYFTLKKNNEVNSQNLDKQIANQNSALEFQVNTQTQNMWNQLSEERNNRFEQNDNERKNLEYQVMSQRKTALDKEWIETVRKIFAETLHISMLLDNAHNRTKGVQASLDLDLYAAINTYIAMLQENGAEC